MLMNQTELKTITKTMTMMKSLVITVLKLMMMMIAKMITMTMKMCHTGLSRITHHMESVTKSNERGLSQQEDRRSSKKLPGNHEQNGRHPN